MGRIRDLLASSDPIPAVGSDEFLTYPLAERRLINNCGGSKVTLLKLARRRFNRTGAYSAMSPGYLVSDVACTATAEGQLLESSTAGSGYHFGSGMKQLGNELFIGERATPNPDLFNFQTGSIHYFTRADENSDWVHQNRFFPDDGGGSGVQFGNGVAYDGSRVCGGSPNVNRSVDIWTVAAGVRTFEQEITQAAATAASNFGIELDIKGDHMLVGAPLDLSATGRVEYWQRVGGTWTYQNSLLTSEAGSTNFGSGIAMTDDSTAYILRKNEDAGSGISIEKWTRSGSTWSFNSHVIEDYTTYGGPNTKAPLDTDGTNLILGIPFYDNGGGAGDDYGAVVIMDLTGTVLVEIVGDTLDNEFGFGVTIDGYEGCLGEPNADPSAVSNAGTASAWDFCW